jgi:hypothetical protein
VKQVESNVQQLTEGVQRFFRGASVYASERGFAPIREGISVKSNLEWYENFKLLDFLQQVGIHARVNTMLARDRYVDCYRHKYASTESHTQRSLATRITPGHVVYRVHVPAPPRLRLLLPQQAPQLPNPSGRLRPVGEHRRRSRVYPQSQRLLKDARAGAFRYNDATAHDGIWSQVWQERRKRGVDEGGLDECV